MARSFNFNVRPHKTWITIDHGNHCKGILCDLLHCVSKSLNFTYILQQNFNKKVTNESWLQTNIDLFKNVKSPCMKIKSNLIISYVKSATKVKWQPPLVVINYTSKHCT